MSSPSTRPRIVSEILMLSFPFHILKLTAKQQFLPVHADQLQAAAIENQIAFDRPDHDSLGPKLEDSLLSFDCAEIVSSGRSNRSARPIRT